MKQAKKSQPRFSKLSIYVAVYSVLTTVALSLIGGYVFFDHMAVTSMNKNDKTIVQLIDDAVGKISDPIPRDARSGNYYLPESKLNFAALAAPKDLMYYMEQDNIHMPAQKGYNLALSHARSATELEESFSFVPKMQACNRGYLLSFSTPDTESLGVKILFSKKLRDGRTLTVSKDSECADFDSETEEALRTIDSY